VASAAGSAQDVFRQVRLAPLAPLDKLELVLIQVTFTPEPLPLPGSEPAEDAETFPDDAALTDGDASP
jgi:hypothetical protein